jgi:hypothetical protein
MTFPMSYLADKFDGEILGIKKNLYGGSKYLASVSLYPAVNIWRKVRGALRPRGH